MYFEVDDIHNVVAALKAKGVPFKGTPHVINRTGKAELWLAEFADPDGNQLALLCNAPRADT